MNDSFVININNFNVLHFLIKLLNFLKKMTHIKYQKIDLHYKKLCAISFENIHKYKQFFK
jgi:protein-arginine kinase activator protein McsA